MLVAVSTSLLRSLCVVDAALTLAQYGFRTVELNYAGLLRCSDGVPETVSRLRRAVSRGEVSVLSIHAPYTYVVKNLGLWNGSSPERLAGVYWSLIAPIVEAAEPRMIIVHPMHVKAVANPEEFTLTFLELLRDWALSSGTILAVENLIRDEEPWSDVGRVAELARSIGAGVCLDVGHANYARQGIPAAAEHLLRHGLLVSMHLHDNDGSADQHLPPFTGAVEWRRLFAVLKSYGYRGPGVIEAGCSEPMAKCLNWLSLLRVLKPFLEELRVP